MSNFFKGLGKHLPNDTSRLTIGVDSSHECDVSSGDYDVPADWQNCRAVRATTAGVVRVQQLRSDGVAEDTVIAVGPQEHPRRRITKVYRYLDGSSGAEATTTFHKAADASEVIGVILDR